MSHHLPIDLSYQHFLSVFSKLDSTNQVLIEVLIDAVDDNDTDAIKQAIDDLIAYNGSSPELVAAYEKLGVIEGANHG